MFENTWRCACSTGAAASLRRTSTCRFSHWAPGRFFLRTGFTSVRSASACRSAVGMRVQAAPASVNKMKELVMEGKINFLLGQIGNALAVVAPEGDGDGRALDGEAEHPGGRRARWR